MWSPRPRGGAAGRGAASTRPYGGVRGCPSFRKVFHKLGLWVSEEDIRRVVASTPGAIEPILCALRERVERGAVPVGVPASPLAPERPMERGPAKWGLLVPTARARRR